LTSWVCFSAAPAAARRLYLVMNRFTAPEPPVPVILRRTAEILRAGGFAPSAYFVNGSESCIDIDCSPEQMVSVSHRLHVFLADVPGYIRACDGDDTDDEPYVAIQAVYDPAGREATIELWGLRDSMLR
jgi:hypothetical protein